jgi:hypothetical protein
MPNRVVRSTNNDAGDRCVDIFLREDGTYGFEEYRRDHEDLKGWFPLQHFSTQVFETEEGAAERARATVAWLAVAGQ